MAQHFGSWYAQTLDELIEEFNAFKAAYPDTWETLDQEETERFIGEYRKKKQEDKDEADQDN